MSKQTVKHNTKVKTKRPKQDVERLKAQGTPKWEDCSWRRVPCGEDSCPLCGQVARARAKHIARGKDPDSIEAIMDDVMENFRETLSVLKKDVKKLELKVDNIKEGKKIIEPPEPHEFPLYNKITAWRKGLYKIADASDSTSSTWLHMDAGQDILWYANTLTAKTYRQLSNRWEIERGNKKIIDIDYSYNGRIISECLRILKESLGEISQMDITQKGQFSIALLCLNGFEGDVLELVKSKSS